MSSNDAGSDVDPLAILGLDASGALKLGEAGLREALSRCRKQWTLDAADPSRRAEALRRLKRLQALEKELERAGGLQAYLRQIDAGPSHDAELEILIELARAGRPSLSRRQGELIRGEAMARGIPPRAVDAFLARVPIGDPASSSDPVAAAIPLPSRSPCLSPGELRAIHEPLGGTGKATYYQLLGASPGTSREGLAIAAGRAAGEGDGRDLDRRSEALRGGLARWRHLLDEPDGRHRYDNALFNDSIHRFVKIVDLVLCGDDTTHDQVDRLAEFGARDFGLSLEAVRQCIAARMAALGVSIRLRPGDVRFRTELARLAQAAAERARQEAEAQRLLDEYEDAVKRRRLYSAASLLARLESAGVASDEEMGRTLELRLARIRGELASIDEVARDPALALRALERYAAVLRSCADCSEALLGVRTLPVAAPPAPIHVEATRHGEARRLTWQVQGSAPPGCVYRVLRACTAPGPPPTEYPEGSFQLIFEGPETVHADIERLPAGSIVAYAVMAVLRGTIRVHGKPVREYEAASGAGMSAPVLLWNEVRSLRIDAEANTVRLSFLPPGGSRQVVVERWVGGPEDRPASPTVLAGSSTGAIDDGVFEPGACHTYRAFAVYDGPAGDFHTPGTHARHRAPAPAVVQPVGPAEDPDQSEGAMGGEAARGAEPPRVASSSSRLLWRFVPDWPTRPFRGCPAVGRDGRIHACLGDRVVALTADGELAWAYGTAGPIPGSPTLDAEGRVHVHAGDGRLHRIGDDGRPDRPPIDVGEPQGWASPLVDRAGVAWICAQGGGLLRIEPNRDATARRFLRTPRRFDCIGLIRGGILIVGGEDACVAAIDVRGARGKELWDALDDRGRTGGPVNSALAIDADSRVVAAGRDDVLRGFDEEGREAWSFALPGRLMGSPVVDGDGRIYLGLTRPGAAAGGALACVERDGGRCRWNYPTAAAVESTPVIGDDGIIYFGDNLGRVHAVDGEGRAVWTDRLDSPVRSAATIAASNRLVLGLEDGSLVALECSSAGLGGGWPKLMRDLPQVPVLD
ncbi:Outer membrane protein assembly factor BamB [Aquisphaera giovannonii]|uniref:Outer membrane protein assembly factor BamB n=1 Tax=Aquisphaera giovannonii TaxID=406548 RepID=A0A5B9VU40_9BACT|nr:PQQ-binding-like beta-propeller repeat protein [Aquisphaera giovannonii]QEH32066.1 Outer membrane protein assembly factor BamB [Aquisphaera giovannonii]